MKNKTKKKKISKKKAIDGSTHDIMQYCAERNSFSFNMNKALEECVEFSEVLLKLQTKKPENLKGITRESALDEFGDLLYRGKIALKSLFPEFSLEEINILLQNRHNSKLLKAQTYLKEGKYKGGL